MPGAEPSDYALEILFEWRASPEQRLWQRWLWLLLRDATNQSERFDGCRQVKTIADARQWLTIGVHKNMEFIADCVDLEPEAVLRAGRALKAAGWPKLKINEKEIEGESDSEDELELVAA
jgi:hypothetical protein